MYVNSFGDKNTPKMSEMEKFTPVAKKIYTAAGSDKSHLWINCGQNVSELFFLVQSFWVHSSYRSHDFILSKTLGASLTPQGKEKMGDDLSQI